MIAFPVMYLGWAWLFWWPVLRSDTSVWEWPNLPWFLAGGASPLLAAVLLAGLEGGRGRVADLFRRLVDWRRIPRFWWPVLLAYWLLFDLAMAGLAIPLGITESPLDVRRDLLTDPRPLLFLVLLSFVFPAVEEIGLRGYYFDALRRKLTPAVAGVLNGVVWAMWHAPFVWFPGYYAETAFQPALSWWLPLIVCNALLIVFVYERTNRSILAALIFHGMMNSTGEWLGISPEMYPFMLWGNVLMALLVVTWMWAHERYRQRMAEAEAAWAHIAARAAPVADCFAPERVAGLPEIARRYFLHAIASGTPLSTTVELRMEGRFRLGGQDNFRELGMQARQILAPPDAFVWLPAMRRGPLVVTGSDGLIDGEAWTRFWLLGSIPLVQAAGTEDLRRAALARPVLEAIWAPASLLPRNGARWEQVGPDAARIVFGTEGIPLEMTLDPDGRVLSVAALRWTDANPGRTFRLQPFGGTMKGERTFGGFTIPNVVRVGNHFGTSEYFPFFLATITDARYR